MSGPIFQHDKGDEVVYAIKKDLNKSAFFPRLLAESFSFGGALVPMGEKGRILKSPNSLLDFVT